MISSRFLTEYNPNQNLVLVSKAIYHDFDLYQGGVVLRNVIDWFLIGYSLLDSDWLIPLSCLLQRSARLDPQLEQVPSLFRKEFQLKHDILLVFHRLHPKHQKILYLFETC